MKIGIDARFLTHPQAGGFKTYTENLVKALSLIDSVNAYVLYLDRPPTEETLPNKNNFVYRVVKGTLPVLGMPVREQFGLPKRIAQDRIDLMHFPCLTASLKSRCPFILALHDTIWLTAQPGSLSSREGHSLKRWTMWLYNKWIPQLAARRARRIITASHATKADIVNQLGICPENISVVPHTIKTLFGLNRSKDQLEATRRRYGLDQGFILGIGSADPRKNMLGLVSAYARVP
jgi:glycosyltransferase involved in cell wall biosynthesis